MKKTVRNRKFLWSWIWAWDHQKEEKWLNEMSEKGMHLTDISFNKYTFEEGTPGEYTIRIAWLERRTSHPNGAKYIEFVEKTGAKYLGSVSQWAFFRKKSDFELFSDIESRIKNLNRFLKYIGFLLALDLSNAALSLSSLQRGPKFYGSYWWVTTGTILTLVYTLIRVYFERRKLIKERVLRE